MCDLESLLPIVRMSNFHQNDFNSQIKFAHLMSAVLGDQFTTTP